MNDMTANSAFLANWVVEDTACLMCGSAEAEKPPNALLPFKVKRCITSTLFFRKLLIAIDAQAASARSFLKVACGWHLRLFLLPTITINVKAKHRSIG